MSLFDQHGDEIHQPDLQDPQGVSDEEAQLLGCMAAEIRTLTVEDEPLVLALAPLQAVQLAGLMQLALRHPDLVDTLRETGGGFVDRVREYFAEAPATLE